MHNTTLVVSNHTELEYYQVGGGSNHPRTKVPSWVPIRALETVCALWQCGAIQLCIKSASVACAQMCNALYYSTCNSPLSKKYYNACVTQPHCVTLQEYKQGWTRVCVCFCCTFMRAQLQTPCELSTHLQVLTAATEVPQLSQLLLHAVPASAPAVGQLTVWLCTLLCLLAPPVLGADVQLCCPRVACQVKLPKAWGGRQHLAGCSWSRHV